jgi:hypothetical protein
MVTPSTFTGTPAREVQGGHHRVGDEETHIRRGQCDRQAAATDGADDRTDDAVAKNVLQDIVAVRLCIVAGGGDATAKHPDLAGRHAAQDHQVTRIVRIRP